MSNPIHDRMARIFFSMLDSEGEMPEGDDMSFFQNHLSSFVKVMNELSIATEILNIQSYLGYVTCTKWLKHVHFMSSLG